MGFFSNLFRGRDAPSNSTGGSGYGFFMGSTASGKRVNARSAMQMTAVYSCVRILSEAVLPIKNPYPLPAVLLEEASLPRNSFPNNFIFIILSKKNKKSTYIP